MKRSLPLDRFCRCGVARNSKTYLGRGLSNFFNPALQPGFVGAQLGALVGQQGLEEGDQLQVALGGGVVVPP